MYMLMEIRMCTHMWMIDVGEMVVDVDKNTVVVV